MVNIPENDLRRLYIDEGKSISTISKMYGCNWYTVKNKLNKYKISIRPYGVFLIDDDETLNSKMEFKIGIGIGLSINENKE